MARIGYACVSTIDQDLDGQVERFGQQDCSIVRWEKTIVQFLLRDDELLVTRLDRLGRDTRDVLNIIP